jgi:hypothetical protein
LLVRIPNAISISGLINSPAGFDIVGQEENPDFNVNSVYKTQIDEVVADTKADTPAKYPFGLTFHTGESTLTNGKAQNNLEFLAEYAKEKQTEFPHLQIRAGHTVLLSKSQAISTEYNKLNIHSELCLLSNNFLGTNNDASDYLKIYQPIVDKNSASLSGDDPTYQQ